VRIRFPRARRVLAIVAALVVLFVLVVVIDGWTAFGTAPDGAREQRVEASPQWDDGVFHNPQPLWNDVWGMLTGIADASDDASPSTAVPVVTGDRSRFATPPATGLRITWLGHSTLIVEIDGRTLLTDPIWGERTSPLTWLGPQRWYAPPIPLAELPPIDAVLISHDHYDHLDYPTIAAMKDWDTVFIAPLGVGAHLEYWGVPVDRIVELDWWDRTSVNGLEIVCTPARHASGRTLFDQDRTLWAGYALVGAQHRVYFSGDTGLFPAMREIGERFGPFDATMIETGAYNRAWPDWHLGPEQAVRAHEMVRGRLMFPVHAWTEPAERVLAAAQLAGIDVVVPRPGQSIEPEDPNMAARPAFERWWPDVPWQTAADHPVVATKMD
jgi:L-ascorbate metabolism protein UlaG (beta-lactamase superfamily)